MALDSSYEYTTLYVYYGVGNYVNAESIALSLGHLPPRISLVIVSINGL